MLSWVGGAGATPALWSVTNLLRLELRPQGMLVTGVHLGHTDTDSIADPDVLETDPSEWPRPSSSPSNR